MQIKCYLPSEFVLGETNVDMDEMQIGVQASIQSWWKGSLTSWSLFTGQEVHPVRS